MLRKEGSYLFRAYTESGSVIVVYATISPPTMNKHTHKCNSNAEVRQDDHCPSGLYCIHDHMTRAATVKKGGRGHCTWSNSVFSTAVWQQKKNTSESITSVHL